MRVDLAAIFCINTPRSRRRAGALAIFRGRRSEGPCRSDGLSGAWQLIVGRSPERVRVRQQCGLLWGVWGVQPRRLL